uniref:hypothetical protein n=1 Tax=Paractinoplanes polyasparticus TaxID=2856853 RepID=UPI001C8494F0|nr:hypothetical protein [Actinoplanes polyasparticus]
MTFTVDGQTVARLRRGATARIEVPGGSHVVRARMDWLRSVPLEVRVDEAAPVSVTAALTEHSTTFTGTFLRPDTALDIRASPARA